MVTGEYPPSMGGVADYTSLLARQLEQLGTAVTVLAPPLAVENRNAEPSPREGVPVVRVQGSWGLSSWRQVARAAQISESSIVHLQYQAAAYGMHPAMNLLPAYIRLRERQLKAVTTFHDLRVPYIFPKAGPIRRQAILALDRWSHASVVTNHADLDNLEASGKLSDSPSQRRWLIPIGSNVECCPPPEFDRQRYRAGLGVDRDTLLLSYFGFMNQSKGVDSLVEALRILVERGIDTRLLVVGGEEGTSDPTNHAYSRQVEELHPDPPGVEKRVGAGRFPGTSKRCQRLYLPLTSVCSPSRMGLPCAGAVWLQRSPMAWLS